MACPQNRELPQKHGDQRDAVEQHEARSRGPSAKAQGQGGARTVAGTETSETQWSSTKPGVGARVLMRRARAGRVRW